MFFLLIVSLISRLKELKCEMFSNLKSSEIEHLALILLADSVDP